METVDWIFLVVLGVFMSMGALRGLVYALMSLVNWVLAFLLAQWLAVDAAQWLPLEGVTSAVRYAAGFVLVFIVAFFVGGLIAVLLKKILGAAGLRPIDRTLGALFGLVCGVLLVLGMTVMINMAPTYVSATWKEAVGPRIANTLLVQLKPLLPEKFESYLP